MPSTVKGLLSVSSIIALKAFPVKINLYLFIFCAQNLLVHLIDIYFFHLVPKTKTLNQRYISRRRKHFKILFQKNIQLYAFNPKVANKE